MTVRGGGRGGGGPTAHEPYRGRRSPQNAAAEGDTRPRLKLIVTIPAFNEEENIGDVIREIPREMPGVASVEVLVLDDGSTDATVTTAWAAGADYVISHNRRLGLARTFRDAIDAALSAAAPTSS